MSFARGPQIVRDGLVLYLDAANKKSYPGTGTVWKDLSGNGNDGTLVGGPTFDSGNKGSIAFDGVDDFSDIIIPQLIGLQTITIDLWTNWLSGTGDMFLGFNTYCVYTSGGALGYNNGDSNNIGISSTKVTELGLIGNFHHYVFVMNSSGLLSQNKIIIDGIDYPLTPQQASDGNVKAFSNILTLCNWNAEGSSWYANLEYSNIRVYNRELNSQEILQNRNALKSRF